VTESGSTSSKTAVPQRNSQGPAWLAVVVSSLTLIATLYFHYLDRGAAINDRLVEHRRAALFDALKVIDHVYSNEPIGREGRPPSPHNWDIQVARDADNQMRVYCRFPETLTSFRTALGLYNRANQKPPGINIEALDQFRGQVARELDLPTPVGSNRDLAWIESLAGATSEPKATQ
jgi:hypothetical protein